MERIHRQEQKFMRINRIFTALYIAFCAGLILLYAVRRDVYHLSISLGTLVVPAGLGLLYRIFRFRRVHQMDFLILTFVFLAYPLGACLDLYRILPGFDKLAHCLSGLFVSLLCLALYYALKPGHAIEAGDGRLAMLFVFFGSMAVAGLWEIGEFLLSALVKIDLQRVQSTSIVDSMLDMIVCLIGTLAALPFVHRLTHGRHDPVTGAVEAFVEINLK